MKKFTKNFIRLFFTILFISITSLILFKFKYNNLIKNININEVPYISTYYIKPIVTTTEDVIISFYITDYYQQEQLINNSSMKFTVTVKINNKNYIIKSGLKAGDHSINIGKFKTIGEQKFSIICTDEYGRNSHELFNFFLVQNNITINEYEMTVSDLKKYNISNNNDAFNTSSTIIGLQRLLDDKKSDGYNKLKLLPGTYLVDASNTIFIPDEFTLDLNNATIKLNGFTGSNSLILSLNNTFNSHVINGIIEGDYYEHDYKNSLDNSEWVNGVSIEGESKYSSFENLTIKNITGYGATNGIANSRDDSLSYSYLPPISIPQFTLGDIDRSSGHDITSYNRTTCDFIDISDYTNINYLTISRYLGYQGNSCNTWNLICHFYDSNKNYISSIDSYQYRRVFIPTTSKYLRVTILNEDYPTDLSIELFRIPTHCAFKNIKFENCRAVGLAQNAMKDMLVENCEFINCGQTLAKCAYDAEDGWDMMQDVTFISLNFHDNPNNDFLTCAGHNFVIENMISGKIHFGNRSNSYVIRNNSNITSAYLDNSSHEKTGYVRVTNNSIKNGIIVSSPTDTQWPLIIKDCIINGRAEGSLNNYFIRCDIGANLFSSESYCNSLGKGNFINCTIHDKNGDHNYGGNYYNCTLNNISGKFQNKFYFSECTFNNFLINTLGDDCAYSFIDSTLNNVQINFPYWFKGATLSLKNCIINNKNYFLKLPHYSMSKQISLINNTFNSDSTDGLILFYDDRITDLNSDTNTLNICDNIFNLPNCKYIICGLSKSTKNKIIIILDNNTINYNKLLCNPDSYYCTKININNIYK